MLHFINPNLHVILIHYPLALLAVGLLVEIFSFLWPRSSFRVAGRWMILLGALATVPAVTTGMYAKASVMQNMSGQSQGAVWNDVKVQANLSVTQWKWINQHVLFNACASALAVFACIVWLSGSDRWRRNMHFPVLLMLIGSMGLMMYGAYGGGELVYSTRFATMDENQARALETPIKAQLHSTDDHEKFVANTEYYVSPLQWHLLSAGLVIASSAVALGLSLRKSSHVRLALVQTQRQADALMAPTDFADPSLMTSESVLPEMEQPVGRLITQPNPRVEPVIVQTTSPASRFWLLTAVLALMTIAGGWFTMSFDFGNHPLWDVRDVFLEQIWQPFRGLDSANNSRLMAHFAIGALIFLLPFPLMAVSRWKAHNRAVISFLALLLIAAVAAQLGVGTLMLYDQDRGPLNHFNPPGTDTQKSISVSQK